MAGSSKFSSTPEANAAFASKAMKLATGLCLILFAASALADLARPGQVTYVEGEVIHSSQNSASDKPAINSAITSGDSLRTGDESRAEIGVGSLTLYLGTNSRLHFLELDDDSVRAYLMQGALIAHVRDGGSELAAPGFGVHFPRPGVYRLDVNGVAKLAVREGEALVTRSNGERFSVSSNQTVGIGSGPMANARDALDRWVEARTEDRPIASGYSPSELPGYPASEGAWVETPEYGAVWMPYESYSGPEPYHGLPRGWIRLEHSSLGFVPFHHGFNKAPGFHLKPPRKHGKRPSRHRHPGSPAKDEFPIKQSANPAMIPTEPMPFKRQIPGREGIQVPPARMESHTLRASPLRSLVSPKQFGQAPATRGGRGVGVERIR